MDQRISPLKSDVANYEPNKKNSTPNMKQTSLVQFLSPKSITNPRLDNTSPIVNEKSKKKMNTPIEHETRLERKKVKSGPSLKTLELKGWLQSNYRKSLQTQNELQLGEQNSKKRDQKKRQNNTNPQNDCDKTQNEKKRKYNRKVQKDEANKLKPIDSKMKGLPEKAAKETKKSLFTKYGVNVPTYKEIIKHHKDLEKKKKQLEELFGNSFDVPETKHINFDFDLSQTENTLDCKSLTKNDLQSAYHNHFDYINSLYKDLKISCRAQTLVTFDKTDIGSMIIFTQEQKLILAKLIQKYIVHDNEIIFKILLPQLCLRIFMDQHNMSEEKAIEYLKIRKCD